MPAPARKPRAISRRAVARFTRLSQRIGKAANAERPQIRELRQIDDFAGDDDHGGLQFVDRAGERDAIGDAGLDAQV